MKNHSSRKGGNSSSSSGSNSSKKSADRLERTLLDQDFAERIGAIDRINRFQRERQLQTIRNQPNPNPSAPPASAVDAEAIRLVYDDENVDPNHEPEGAGGDCTYADLSKDDLLRARGDFQEWERNVKKGATQQSPPQKPPQKPPKKARKPAKPAPPPLVDESTYVTGAEVAAAATASTVEVAPAADGGAAEAADQEDAPQNDVGDEPTEVVYASIVGVLKR